jgi:cold shock CspA family protein/ribosome-associated translation inhibitor RaiA
MQVPPEITYRDVVKTDALENLILEKIEKLDQMHTDIISCRVAVEKPQSHQQTGSDYRVRILLRTPPNHDLVAKRNSTKGEMHEALETVIRDAFDSMQTQLRRLVDIQHDEVKEHPDQQVNGIVQQIFPEEGYGFLQLTDGTSVYFHKNSVINREFDSLDVGTGVHSQIETGEKGPQATTVRIIEKPTL